MLEMQSRSGGASLSSPAPVSRLQLMQAQFQRKLLLEKQEKMMELYSNHGVGGGGGGGGHQRGGAVRQFFAQRRTNGNLDPLNSSGGLISLQQSFNGGNGNNNNNNYQSGTYTKANKHHAVGGSPVGWDKSYPLSPMMDRDSSGGSSSGYDSGNSFGSNFGGGNSPYRTTNNNNNNRRNAPRNPPPPPQGSRPRPPPPAVQARRAPSLDRRPRNRPNNNAGGMRRSNSQILNGHHNRGYDDDDDDRDQYAPSPRARKTVPPPPQQNKASYAPAKGPPPPPRNNFKSPPQAVARSMVVHKTNSAGHYYEDEEDVDGDSATTPSKVHTKAPLVPAIGYVPPTKPSSSAVKKSSSAGGRMALSAPDPNLVECHRCGRRFARDRIDKHEDICDKSNSKKRQVFDPAKMRMKGTELEEFVIKTARGGRSKARQPEPQPVKKSDWRQKRNNFIESLRQAKQVQRHVAAGGKVSDLPPPPPMDTSDYVQCPHCNRKFSDGVAERHIPKCMNIKSNKNPTIARR